MATVSIPTTTPAAVDTVAELAEVSGTAGEAMIVAGRATVGDGGGGSWTWNGSSTAAHDGALVVRPTEIAAAAAGRWLRSYDGPIDARWFGCLPGLGSLLPQNENLQLALDAVAAIGRGHIRIAAGIYDWADAVSVGSNTRISGDGVGMTVLRGKAGSYAGKTVNGNVLYATIGAVAKNHVTIEHLTVDHQTNGTTANGIALIPDGVNFVGTYCTDCTIQNCEVLGYEANQYLIWSMRGRRIHIAGNIVDGYTTVLPSIYGQEGIETFGGYDVLIQGNIVRRCAAAGINGGAAVDMPNAECTGIVVSGNIVEACGQGIHFGTAWDATNGAQNLTNILIAGNSIRACTEGVYINTPIAGTTLSNVVIEGNVITGGAVGIRLLGISGETTHYGVAVRDNAVRSATTTTEGAITAAFMSAVQIANNAISSSGGEAVRLSSLLGGTFSGNTVNGAQKQAVYADSCNKTVIARNSFLSYALGAGVAGLLSTSSVMVAVVDNEFSQAGAGTDVIVAGTSGIVAGNIALATGAAVPFTNSCTNANFGTTPAMTAGATTIDVTNTLMRGQLPRVLQSAGTIRPFSVSLISGGFRITVNAAATGNETFAWEIV